ncbi:NADP-dependent oxidoreductase [Pseudomonas matsuisoli]|uniref:NADP-dependent oxidoreductase n=1 Tax=Pseudomonas matsuisoli TaxID=1515666 RepID=A0A917UTS4_9PSED|nr:NADP-dependent oxidoreductase [Pseudomonas matsuisoli]GGJ85363.1 NADP-dependent oxidoreductase [Pseudomonas matsuisoli]
MSNVKSTRIVLAARPSGRPAEDDFRTQTEELPALKDGQVLLKILYLSLDPYMRERMKDAKSYAPPLQIGDVIVGGTVGEVVESRHGEFSPGDTVLSYSGWKTHAVEDGESLRKLDPSKTPVTTALGVLGMPGFTAYSGLLTIGQPKPGETVVVAAASGPVGSAVGQIARLKGARVVGIAGGAKKCALLKNEFDFDEAIDHRGEDFPERLKAACPQGIDVYFENVGGPVWDAVFPLLNTYARVPVCGLVAHYNQTGAAEGSDRLPGMMREILHKSLTIRGFIQTEFVETQMCAFSEEMSEWVANGQVKYREDIIDGLENAPAAFAGLLEGKNVGKLIVKL